MNKTGLFNEYFTVFIYVVAFLIVVILFATYSGNLRDGFNTISSFSGSSDGDTSIRCYTSADCETGFCCGGYIIDNQGTCRDKTKYVCLT